MFSTGGKKIASIASYLWHLRRFPLLGGGKIKLKKKKQTNHYNNSKDKTKRQGGGGKEKKHPRKPLKKLANFTNAEVEKTDPGWLYHNKGALQCCTRLDKHVRSRPIKPNQKNSILFLDFLMSCSLALRDMKFQECNGKLFIAFDIQVQYRQRCELTTKCLILLGSFCYFFGFYTFHLLKLKKIIIIHPNGRCWNLCAICFMPA